MGKILTIGIPVYNMEKYLHRCLDSVTGISNLEDVEIIVVNDGSKDRSSEIAKGYEQRFPKSVRVIDKPNGGWGSAINRSVAEATGKYYKSLDSDDWFDTANLNRFVTELQTLDADMILSPFNEVDENGNVTSEKVFTPDLYGQTFDLEEYIARQGTLNKTIHAIAYRTQLLKDHDFQVWEKFYGDIDYINTPLTYVKTIHLSPLCLYQYMIGREGQSISIAGYRAHISDYLSVARKLLPSFARTTPTSHVEKYLFEDSINIATFAYKLLLPPSHCWNLPDSKLILKEFDKFLKYNVPLIYLNVSKRNKRLGISPISIWRTFGVNIYAMFSQNNS